MFYRRVLCKLAVTILVGFSPLSALAGQNAPRYEYSAAVQEITQLYWLAETANSCGWATRQEADEFEAFARLLCPKAIADGLTIVARRTDSRELVGVMLTEDCAAEMPEGMDRLSSKFDPILDLLGQLGSEYWGDRSGCRRCARSSSHAA